MRLIKSFLLLLNYKTFLIIFLACFSTYICKEMKWEADYTMTLVSIAIVFPVVFSISSAYQRRENALKELAILKSNALAFYYATRDWTNSSATPLIEKVKDLQKQLFLKIKHFLTCKEDVAFQDEPEIYYCFSELSRITGDLREFGLTPSEITRVGQYHNNMMISFNIIKGIFYYRTPLELRVYYRFFIYVFAVLYGPYFAQLKHSDTLPWWLIYIMPMMFSAILVSLDNIQENLEKPFDGVGQDDIVINVEEHIRLLVD